jgi:hypothetical protein
LPTTFELLVKLPGFNQKTAAILLNEVFSLYIDRVAVDSHVINTAVALEYVDWEDSFFDFELREKEKSMTLINPKRVTATKVGKSLTKWLPRSEIPHWNKVQASWAQLITSPLELEEKYTNEWSDTLVIYGQPILPLDHNNDFTEETPQLRLINEIVEKHFSGSHQHILLNMIDATIAYYNHVGRPKLEQEQEGVQEQQEPEPSEKEEELDDELGMEENVEIGMEVAKEEPGMDKDNNDQEVSDMETAAPDPLWEEEAEAAAALCSFFC